jgi:hypothetical protein
MNGEFILYGILILISSLVIQRLTKKQLEFFNHAIFRFLFLVGIVYLGMKDPVASLLLTVVFVSLVYNLNRYKIKKTFDISLELMHEQHKKESPGPQFEEVDTSLIFKPSSNMGSNEI